MDKREHISVELRRDEDGLALVGGGMVLRADFTHMLSRLAPGKLQRELLVKAARVKGVASPRAIDATAGLGEDSLLLAAAGFEVLMFERDATIAALLRDGLERAASVPELAKTVSRMHVVEGDSMETLRAMAGAPAEEAPDVAAPSAPFSASTFAMSDIDAFGLPDVVYLDPMFPERTKSAAVGKKFQLLHALEAPCADEEELLNAALAARPRKVVVKRPVKGPNLGDVKPSYTIAGKAVRYDCIVIAREG